MSISLQHLWNASCRERGGEEEEEEDNMIGVGRSDRSTTCLPLKVPGLQSLRGRKPLRTPTYGEDVDQALTFPAVVSSSGTTTEGNMDSPTGIRLPKDILDNAYLVPLPRVSGNAFTSTPTGSAYSLKEMGESELKGQKQQQSRKWHVDKKGKDRKGWFANRTLPIACILIPYLLVLICVALFSALMPSLMALKSVNDSIMGYHEYLQLEISSHVVNALNMPPLLSSVFIGLYIKHEARPSPNDDVVPMGFDMTRRLCASLRHMDRMRLLTSAFVASVTRDEIALCSRGFHQNYFATVLLNEEDGLLLGPVAVDPRTLQVVDPPLFLGNFIEAFTLQQLVYNMTDTGSRLDAWKREVEAGRQQPIGMWFIENFLNMRYAYTHPFIEKDGSVSFFKVAVDFNRMIKRMFLRSGNLPHALRVMVLEDDDTGTDIDGTNKESRMRIIGSSWEQDSRYVERSTGVAKESLDTDGDSVNGVLTVFPTLRDVTDPLMRSAVEYTNINSLMHTVRNNNVFYTRFPYDASFATFSAFRVRSDFNASVIVLVAAPTTLFGSLYSSQKIILIVLGITTVGATLMVYVVLNICVIRPLRGIAEDLRVAAKVGTGSAAAATATTTTTTTTTTTIKAPPTLHRAVSSLVEIYNLQRVCVSLQEQLIHLRSFLPEGLFEVERLLQGEASRSCAGLHCRDDIADDERAMSKWNGETAETATNAVHNFDVGLTKNILGDSNDKINTFTDVTCSVVEVCIVDIMDNVECTGEVASVVIQAANKYGGCIDVFVPELFHVIFGFSPRLQSDKLEATYCALEILRNLPDPVRRCCTIVVDSGTFQFGVCGGPERKELVLMGRSIGLDLIHLQRHYGVPLVILQSTASHIRASVHVLPFTSVLLNKPDMPHHVMLYTVIDGIADEAMWRIVEARYCKGFSHLMQEDYCEALTFFEILHLELFLTPQLTQFLRCQMARVHRALDKQFEALPEMMLWPSRSLTFGSNHSMTDGQLQSPASRRTRGGADTALSYSLTSTRPQSPIRNIPQHFWDKDGVRWTRAAEGFVENRRFPVFLGISDTGTLAALKFLPISSLPEIGYKDTRSIEEWWSLALTVYHVNIVQILGFGRTKRHVCLIMEFVPGGTLRQSVSRYGRALPPMAVKRFLVSTLRGLEYLHNRGLVHGNLRPECIMVAVEGVYKLRGIRKMTAAGATVSELQAGYRCGGSAYCSPETFANCTQSAASDIYAVGVMVLEMILNRTPWRWIDRAVTTHAGDASLAEDDSIQRELRPKSQQEEEEEARKARLGLVAILSDFEKTRAALEEGKIALEEVPCDADPVLREVLCSCLAPEPAARKTASELLQLLSDMP
ncbi:protein kinase [Trypanosoma grayi]|uniref:protein kinase n=1 Tax=Trypanosoma grayi TaxID=71804 RepID=UPI0004F48624|nr:protein kinase [Trypanosoma grayi]KEG12875.1 protein kinase [Trypanosoma grayi]